MKPKDVKRLHFMSADTPYEKADAVMVGLGFDGTVTFRPGTRFAPSAIRQASYNLEEYSHLLKRDLAEIKVCDLGDLDLVGVSPAAALKSIRKVMKEIVADGKKPVVLGGEHLVSLPVVQEVLTAHPALNILHFDAHTDLRSGYLGESLSHASVMFHIQNKLAGGVLAQVGIRSGTKEEFTLMEKKLKSLLPPKREAVAAWVKKIGRCPLYVSLDLDVLDPSVAPGVGTPEPGGLSFAELQDMIAVLTKANLVGCDIVELCPPVDPSGVSAMAAAKLMRELLLLLGK